MATYPVTHINSEMRGAPIINGNTRGNLIAAIDAWRLGFGQVTAISVTVSNGVATATLQPSQGFDLHTVIEVAGVTTPAALNGKSRVAEVSADKTVIKFPTDAPNGTATGTITIKVAGSGWDKPFSAANKAVYRSADPLGARHFYRIDETGTPAMARVRGFENMTTVDAGTGLYPTNAQINGGGYWVKSTMSDATPVRYDIVGDARFVLVAIALGYAQSSSYTGGIVRGFGDPLALSPAGDPFGACVSCNLEAPASSFQYGGFTGPTSTGSGAVYAARARSATGTARDLAVTPFVGAINGGMSGNDATLGELANQIDGRMKLSQLFLREGAGSSTSEPRSVVPGLLHVPHRGVASLVQPRDFLIGTGAFDGRILMATHVVLYPGASPDVNFIDLTGPWRVPA